ncbi:MAG: hypothetical protein ISR77_06990 [Pirellulaceae bacterium]|nr:hypothetical protein [Pirellulaceae bacterium]
MRSSLFTMAFIAIASAPNVVFGQNLREASELFPLTRDRFGTLGAPNSKDAWDVLGARWFKAGDCYWQGGDWVPANRIQTWLLVRPRMYFTGNNRVWNPPPKPPTWEYRNKTTEFIERNKNRIEIIALGNSICFADIESGYYDIDEYVKWYHDFHQFVHRLNPRIKIAPGDLQSAWGGLQGTEQLEGYMAAYKKKYGQPMPIDGVGLHCYITGNKPPDWAKPEVISVETFKQKIRTMRTFMKRIGLQGTAFVITEMGMFNHHCEPRLADAWLFEIMNGAIEFMEGPEGMDKELGMPSDKYRLVQKWSYSAFPHMVRDGRLTSRGKVYRALVDKYAD